MIDPHDLQRFVDAQEPVYTAVLQELTAGRKRSHWMWFVFPQLRGLGHSATARHYGIASAAEALEYWQHPLLGPRLRQCTEIVCGLQGVSAHELFGSSDDLKFRSCMTLFAHVAPHEPLFQQALDAYYAGEPDGATLELLEC